MKTHIFLYCCVTAPVALSGLVLGAPLLASKTAAIRPPPPLRATRPPLIGLDMAHEDVLDAPKLDNRDYIPKPTDTPSQVLRQDRPVPSLYLMSLERPSPDEGGDDRTGDAAWFGFHPLGARPASRLEEDTTHRVPGYDNSDVVVIAMLAAFLVIVAFIELRNRALAAAAEASCKMSFVVGLPGSVKLKGGEKQLLAGTQGPTRPTELVITGGN
ncbi:hypothetical protein MKZ38_010018 [Zalerion maritima]|uniref:Uncharacterized protein n=1 Tax=Zalerion maritima TaxID=339359 RepID=A0AAD5WSP9_9PEZI|nr:hypothetical protein MKZ38_010018 [Zalerion maritima]